MSQKSEKLDPLTIAIAVLAILATLYGLSLEPIQ